MATIVAEKISFKTMGNTLPPLEKGNGLQAGILSILLPKKNVKANARQVPCDITILKGPFEK